jgi:hypothetical protein
MKYEEFVSMLYNGELDSLIKSGDINPSGLHGGMKLFGAERERGTEIRERGFVTNVKNNPDISDQVKSAFTANGTIYERLPNTVSVEEAIAIINSLGLERAKEHVLSGSKNMPPVYRVVMAQILIKKYNESGDFADAVDVAEGVAQLGTDLGQAIQAFSLFKSLTPEGQLISVQREVKKQREKKVKQSKPSIDKIEKDLKKIQSETAKEVAEKFGGKGRGDKSSAMPTTVSFPKNYGSKNKGISKEDYEKARQALLNKISEKGPEGPKKGQPSAPREESFPDEIFTIAQFHYEASNGNKEDFENNLRQDIGPSINPYIDMLFELSQEDEASNKFNDQVDTLKDKLDSLINPSERKEPSERKSREDRILETAMELDSLLGGSFYTDYVQDEINNIKTQKLIDEFEKTIYPSKPKEKGERKSKEDKAKDLALQIQALTGDPTYSQMADEYAQEIEEQKKQKEEKRQKEIDEKRRLRDIKDQQRKQAADIKKAQKQAESQRKKDQRKADSAARKQQRIQQAKINKAKSERGILEGLKGLGTNMNELIRQHFESQNATKEELIKKLVNEAGVTGAEANKLADEISNEFDRIATERKQKALDRALKTTGKREANKKNDIDKLIEQSNMGGLDRALLDEAYADAMGFPKLTDENVKRLKELSKEVQEAKGEKEKERALYELMKYRENIKGYSWFETIQSMWLANILSGWKTQAANIVANSINTAFLFTTGIVRRPTSVRYLTRGFLTGIKRGFFEAIDVMQTGQSPLRGKVEAPTNLEQRQFIGGRINPFNWAKYVSRTMVAADTFFYEGLKQMKMYQMAQNMAIEEKKSNKDISVRKRVDEILNRDNVALKAATDQAKQEREESESKVIDLYDDKKIDKKEFNRRMRNIKFNERFRIHELLEASRPEEMKNEAQEFAAQGTFNYKPSGLLGVLSNSMNDVLRKVPVARFVVPFVNIISNVANETINYSPLGFIRLNKNGSISGMFGGESLQREMTQDQKKDLLAKASIGTTLAIVTYMLTKLKDDDDEPILEITNKGYGDYSKNADLQAQGWQEYSFRVKNPFTGEYTGWISYKYTPIMPMLAMMGAEGDYERYRDGQIDDSYFTKMGIMASFFVRSLADSTFLSSAEDFLNMILDEGNENMFEGLTRWVQKTSAGVVPNLYIQTAQKFEEIMNVPQKEIRETYLGRILRDIPVARDQYQNKVGGLGNDIPYDTDFLYSVDKNTEDDKYYDLLIKNKTSLGSPRWSTTIVDENGNERLLSEEEFYKFSKIRGHFIKSMMDHYYDDLSNSNQEDFKQKMNTIKSESSQWAKIFCTVDIPKDTQDYWSYISNTYPQYLFQRYSGVPKNILLSTYYIQYMDQKMKDNPLKEEIRELKKGIYEDINKNKYPDIK